MNFKDLNAKSKLISITSLLALSSMTAFADMPFAQQWALANTGQEACDMDGHCQKGKLGADIKAEKAWTTSKDCRSVIVAVLDTGADYTHPNLKANLLPGKNFSASTPTDDATDDNLHGTHVSGTIAATGANGSVSGICQSAKVLEVKVGDAEGRLSDSDIIAGIKFASSKGARVVNGSFGGGGKSTLISNAIKAAKNTLFVFSAGNGDQFGRGFDIDKTPVYPAAYPLANIIAVAASDNRDGLGSFSNFGAKTVAIAAPGVGILSTLPMSPTQEMKTYGLPTQYGNLDGTSMAAPHVSGAATLLASRSTAMTPSQLKAKLIGSVDAVASVSKKVSSGGRLNLAKLIANK